jgi:hypothetical protein
MMPNPQQMGQGRNEDRLREAHGERLAGQTRKGRMSAARRASMATAAVMAWMIRLAGGGGGI